jgi:hypothetical protein
MPVIAAAQVSAPAAQTPPARRPLDPRAIALGASLVIAGILVVNARQLRKRP